MSLWGQGEVTQSQAQIIPAVNLGENIVICCVFQTQSGGYCCTHCAFQHAADQE